MNPLWLPYKHTVICSVLLGSEYYTSVCIYVQRVYRWFDFATYNIIIRSNMNPADGCRRNDWASANETTIAQIERETWIYVWLWRTVDDENTYTQLQRILFLYVYESTYFIRFTYSRSNRNVESVRTIKNGGTDNGVVYFHHYSHKNAHKTEIIKIQTNEHNWRCEEHTNEFNCIRRQAFSKEKKRNKRNDMKRQEPKTHWNSIENKIFE